MPIPATAAPRHDHGRNFGVHGMLVVGGGNAERGPVYLSHLPMFAAPHDFQVILEVTGSAADRFGDLVAEAGPFGVATFEPEPFALDELDPSLGADRRGSFAGTLYRGHFERGGTPVASGVTAEVARVVHYRQFAAELAEPQALCYLCFGRRAHAFAAHLITAPPDFDQVVAVDLGEDGPADDDLLAGVVVSVPDRANALATRLHEGDTTTASVDGHGGGPEASLALSVTHEIYLETGDLAG